MTKKKKIIISAVSVAAAAAIAVSGILIWKNSSDEFEDSGKVYVSKVEEVNTAASFSLGGECFSGVVEPQKSYDVKYDSTKKIKEILVKEGDTVKEGTDLFTYDVEAMKLEQEQAELEIERMNNEISSMKKQISELESEKKNVSKDEQYSYTAQIQSLETDVAKVEYDIKVKNTDIDKIKNSISNSTVKSEVSGTVSKVNNISDSSDDEYMNDYYGYGQESSDVLITITESGNFRVKGKINEQNMMLIYEEMPVVIRSRIDDTMTWNGIVSEISTEPAADTQNMYMDGNSDDMTTSSNYNFYITPETTDGLMLGQHVIIEPDSGQISTVEKEGIWIYEDYIQTDSDGKNFVWATDKKDRLEKRYVETGEHDDMYGDTEIVNGLDESDCIAYPSDDYKEGMHTTTNIEEADFEEDFGDDMADDDMMDGDIIDGGMIDDGMIDDGMIDDGMIDGDMIDGDMIIDDRMIDADMADAE